VLAVEFLRVNADALLCILSREKTLRQRRPFVWNGIIGRHDCKLAGPQPALDHFLRGVTRDHSSTEDHVLGCLHASPAPLGNISLYRFGPTFDLCVTAVMCDCTLLI
jgi:hypothetical protein